MDKYIESLKDIIPRGKENAIHQKELSKRLHLKDSATKLVIHKAREQGLEIISGNCGYWFAENDEEKQAFVNMMRRQAISRFKSVKAIKSTLETMQGQISVTEAFVDVSEGGGIL